MTKNTSLTISVLLASSLSLTYAGLQIKPRVGYDLNFISISQNNGQEIVQFPFSGDSTFKTYSNGDVAANPIYFPQNETSPYSTAKDNLDSANFKHLYAGVELSFIDEAQRPSSSFQIAPVMTGYLLLEDANAAGIHTGAYLLSANNAAGADLGLLLTSNGYYLHLGGGARFFQGEFETSVLFAGMSLVTQGGDTDPDTTLLQKTEADGDKKPYTAKIENLILPYAYTELSTEIGDIASAFIRLQYGIKVSPEFTDVPENTQMFSGNQDAFEKNINFQQFAATFGVQTRISDLG